MSEVRGGRVVGGFSLRRAVFFPTPRPPLSNSLVGACASSWSARRSSRDCISSLMAADPLAAGGAGRRRRGGRRDGAGTGACAAGLAAALATPRGPARPPMARRAAARSRIAEAGRVGMWEGCV